MNPQTYGLPLVRCCLFIFVSPGLALSVGALASWWQAITSEPVIIFI